MIEQVGQTVKDECESEFIHSSDTSALLLRQMMLQADQWKLKLSADVQQLENRALIQLIRDFEKMESNLSSTKNFNAQKLTPIQDEGKTIKSIYKRSKPQNRRRFAEDPILNFHLRTHRTASKRNNKTARREY